MEIKNCSECPQFERGFLSEPNECGWFQDYVVVPKKGIPIWCPLNHKETTRDQLLLLYRLEHVIADHLVQLSYSEDLRSNEEEIKEAAKLVYPDNHIKAGEIEVALKDFSGNKINEIWKQLKDSLK
jgi:hypothetical protein